MRTAPATSIALSVYAAFAAARGGELQSLENEAVSFLEEYLSADYTPLITELGGVLASAVPASAVISDLPALVSEVKPLLTPFESEVAAYFKSGLAELDAPSAIVNAIPAVATGLIADAVDALEEVITSVLPATMAITAVPAALASEEAAVLSFVPELGKEIFSELGPDIAPISKQLASWLPGAVSTLEGLTGYNATASSGVAASTTVYTSVTPAAPANSTSVVPATGGAVERGVVGGVAGVVALVAAVVCL